MSLTCKVTEQTTLADTVSIVHFATYDYETGSHPNQTRSHPDHIRIKPDHTRIKPSCLMLRHYRYDKHTARSSPLFTPRVGLSVEASAEFGMSPLKSPEKITLFPRVRVFAALTPGLSRHIPASRIK